MIREPWNYQITKLCYDYGTLEYTSHELSATEFVKQIKKYEPHQELVIAAFQEYLRVLDMCIQEEADQSRTKKEAQIEEEKAAASWLDAILENR